MRRPECASYCSCLDRHADQNDDFACQGCGRYQHADMALNDLAGLLAVFVAVVAPELFERLRSDPQWRYLALSALIGAMTDSRPWNPENYPSGPQVAGGGAVVVVKGGLCEAWMP